MGAEGDCLSLPTLERDLAEIDYAEIEMSVLMRLGGASKAGLGKLVKPLGSGPRDFVGSNPTSRNTRA